jgi:predicted ArsR family transcriptional regulator
VTAKALDDRVIRAIRRVPDQRADEIAERLGEPTVDVRRSLYRLKNARRVRTSGVKRGTTYRAT